LGPEVDLHLDGGEEVVHVGLSFPLEFHAPDSSPRRPDPKTRGWQELSVLLRVLGDRVARATAWIDSSLEIMFEGGRTLTRHADPDVETWEVSSHGPSASNFMGA
jgi:hypothetical protein